MTSSNSIVYATAVSWMVCPKFTGVWQNSLNQCHTMILNWLKDYSNKVVWLYFSFLWLRRGGLYYGNPMPIKK